MYSFAAMAQEVERRLGKAEATGSNPVSSFILLSGHARLGVACFVFLIGEYGNFSLFWVRSMENLFCFG